VESSRQVWNDEVLNLETKIGAELHIALEKTILYVNGNGKIAVRKLKCDSQRSVPTIRFYKVFNLKNRKLEDCLRYMLFHKIEDAMMIVPDLTAAIEAPPRRRRHRINRKGRKPINI